MGNTPQTLRGIYEGIGRGDLAGLMRLLADDALYERLFTNIARHGKAAIQTELTGWANYFQGMRIDYLEVQETPTMVGRFEGAARCYLVKFDLLARYVRQPTWIEVLASNPPGNIRVAFTDRVWLNAAGRIICIRNSVGTMFST